MTSSSAKQTRHGAVRVGCRGFFGKAALDCADRLTSYWWDDLVQQFHACAFPDLLYDGSQLLVGLFKVTYFTYKLK